MTPRPGPWMEPPFKVLSGVDSAGCAQAPDMPRDRPQPDTTLEPRPILFERLIEDGGRENPSTGTGVGAGAGADDATHRDARSTSRPPDARRARRHRRSEGRGSACA